MSASRHHDDVSRYVSMFAALHDLAVFGEEADDLLRSTAQRYATFGPV